MNGRLIYIINETQGILFRNLAFYMVDLRDRKRRLITHMPLSYRRNAIMSYCRLLTRLVRLEPKCAGRLDENRYVVCVLGKLWLLNAQERTITQLAAMRSGYSILNFCEHDGCLYWGDYGTNSNHEEINIYRLDKNLHRDIVYRFAPNSIRHIHNIISVDNGFIVMAGDNEPQAGIYHANADWTEVIPWKIGQQKYRAVVGFPYKGGLLYATDSVETDNYIRLISANGEEKILTAINGSCIYGTEIKDYYLFSTTVEPHEGRGIKNLFSNKLGDGIKSKDVHIIAVNKYDLSVRVVKEYKKDIWPMKLFQYGAIIFPKGQEDNIKGVWCYNVACRKHDGKSEYIKII